MALGSKGCSLMGKTSIEWTDASWNPIVGCSEVSPGCANCYAARLAATRLREIPAYKGLGKWEVSQNMKTSVLTKKSRWTGEVRFHPERIEEPLHWRKPRKIFVCDMGDLFHEGVTDEQIANVFWTMASCRQHTFQVLTKRAERMSQFLSSKENVRSALEERWDPSIWPLPNVWLGVSVENHHFADERIPLLLDTPAAVRWISCEPLLGPVNIRHFLRTVSTAYGHLPPLDWVVCSGESGSNARPMHPNWARSLRDQCQAAGVPFFFKQWGEWAPLGQIDSTRTFVGHNMGDGQMMLRYGKKLAGRLLDGREWNEFPAPAVTS
jgi:protein gp37